MKYLLVWHSQMGKTIKEELQVQNANMRLVIIKKSLDSESTTKLTKWVHNRPELCTAKQIKHIWAFFTLAGSTKPTTHDSGFMTVVISHTASGYVHAHIKGGIWSVISLSICT